MKELKARKQLGKGLLCVDDNVNYEDWERHSQHSLQISEKSGEEGSKDGKVGSLEVNSRESNNSVGRGYGSSIENVPLQRSLSSNPSKKSSGSEERNEPREEEAKEDDSEERYIWERFPLERCDECLPLIQLNWHVETRDNHLVM